jgi:2-polyprenyl-3-methyl-5-hydroxy-6-metoxy-1,4-benzoquinol methylase
MPFPREDLGSLYTDPDEYFSAHDVEAKKKVCQELIRSLENRLQRRGTLLDVGCGRGELLWAARRAGWEFEGVDPSAAYLDWGRVNLGVEAHLGTLEEMNFPEEHFDAILLDGVIEHLYEPYRTLQEVWRLLRPGGVCYMDAPNEDGLYMKIGNIYMRLLGRDWVVNLAPTFPPYHVQGFNPDSLRRLVKRVGFQIEESRIFGEVLPLTGAPSLRKALENRAARFVNWIGNRAGAGMYMDVWLRKNLR